MTQLTEQTVGEATERAITQTVLDYFDGWYDADAARMERACDRSSGRLPKREL